ncbi:hypothetical protein D3C71_1590400 [compost metagenome]
MTPDQGHGGGGTQLVDSVTRTGRRIIIDHHDLAQAVGDAGLEEDGAQGAFQTVGATQGRDDHGDPGRAQGRAHAVSISPTVRMSHPASRVWAIRRDRASGVQPQGECASRTSWV